MNAHERQAPARTAKEQFDRQATHYNAQWNSWTETTLNWLLAHADCQPEDEALDVATGTGFTALAFAPHVRSVVGLDVSSGMLEQARQKQIAQNIANVTWTEGAAESMPFADETFTLVTCRIAPHHFLSLPGFLSEVVRVLKPGGRFLLADTCVPDDDLIAAEWQNQVETLRDPSHVGNRSPREWQALITQAGLNLKEIIGPVGDISIMLDEWIGTAGCTPDQEAQVRHAFDTAPGEANKAFDICFQVPGCMIFTWQRVVAHAVKV